MHPESRTASTFGLLCCLIETARQRILDGDREAALVELRQATALVEDDVPAFFLRPIAVQLAAAGDEETARLLFERAIAETPAGDPEFLFGVVAHACNTGRALEPGAALQVCREQLRVLLPAGAGQGHIERHRIAWVGVLVSLWGNAPGSIVRGREAIEGLVARAPEDPEWRLVLALHLRQAAEVFERCGQPDEAARSLQEAIAVAAGLPSELGRPPRWKADEIEGLRRRAGREAASGERAAALRSYEEANRVILGAHEHQDGFLGFSKAALYADLGEELRRHGRLQDAVRVYRAAVDFDRVAASPDRGKRARMRLALVDCLQATSLHDRSEVSRLLHEALTVLGPVPTHSEGEGALAREIHGRLTGAEERKRSTEEKGSE